MTYLNPILRMKLALRKIKYFAEGGKLGIPNPDFLTEITKPTYGAAWRGSQTVRVPIEDIEHGESAMPGGKLTWPGAWDLIKSYASKPTRIPPIETLPPDIENPKWMVIDGSHRLEAAKLRGDTHIDVNYNSVLTGEMP